MSEKSEKHELYRLGRQRNYWDTSRQAVFNKLLKRLKKEPANG